MIHRPGPGAAELGEGAIAAHYTSRVGDQVVLTLQRCEDEDRRVICENVMSGREALLLASDLLRHAATIGVET